MCRIGDRRLPARTSGGTESEYLGSSPSPAAMKFQLASASMKVHLWDLDEKGSLGDFPGIFEKKIESLSADRQASSAARSVATQS